MKLDRFFSLAAFLAYYHALLADSSRDPQHQRQIAALEELLELLRPAERDALLNADQAPAARYHRERAANRLERILKARGVLG